MVAWIAIFVVVAFGARSLLSGGLPDVGQLLQIPAPGSLMAQFADGHHLFGAQNAAASTPATLLLGIVGYLLFGSVGLLQTVVVVGCLPLGALGVARLCRSFASPWAPVVAAGCYLALPLPYDDIATGRLDALFAYAAVPWLMLGLARVSQLKPFEHPEGQRAAGNSGAPSAAGAAGAAGASGASGPVRLVGRLALPVRRVLVLGAGLAVLLAFDPPARSCVRCTRCRPVSRHLDHGRRGSPKGCRPRRCRRRSGRSWSL